VTVFVVHNVIMSMVDATKIRHLSRGYKGSRDPDHKKNHRHPTNATTKG
jgi:hypothetical protein